MQFNSDIIQATRATILQLCTERHLTVHQLASKAMLSPSTLYSALNHHNRRGLTIRMLLLISYALGLTPAQFFKLITLKDSTIG